MTSGLLPTIGRRLPRPLFRVLFGDRERFGLVADPEDPSWQEWQRRCLEFYDSTQRTSVGEIVNDAGYRVMREVDLTDRSVLEIGPGEISHHRFWKGRPGLITLADVRQAMLDRSAAILQAAGVPHRSILVDASRPVTDFIGTATYDVVLSFYSLEHLNPLDESLAAYCRLLRPGGLLVGAIPCEGGIGWGLGRFLTSRRWLRRHTTVDPDRIICWEHPNFADSILERLDQRLDRRLLRLWPTGLPSLDVNLVAAFIYARPGA